MPEFFVLHTPFYTRPFLQCTGARYLIERDHYAKVAPTKASRLASHEGPPRQKLGKGKTPVLTAEEAGELLRSIKTDDVLGLRDRALIGVMVFTFARISAACGLNVADIFYQQRRLWVRLHEKGGKFHEMPCHHTLEGYLAEYIERARLAEARRVPLFQAIKYRPYGRGEALNGEQLHRNDATTPFAVLASQP